MTGSHSRARARRAGVVLGWAAGLIAYTIALWLLARLLHWLSLQQILTLAY